MIKREGVWRKYTLQSDLIAIENYKYGGKDGLSQYYTPLGRIDKRRKLASLQSGCNPMIQFLFMEPAAMKLLVIK